MILVIKSPPPHMPCVCASPCCMAYLRLNAIWIKQRDNGKSDLFYYRNKSFSVLNLMQSLNWFWIKSIGCWLANKKKKARFGSENYYHMKFSIFSMTVEGHTHGKRLPPARSPPHPLSMVWIACRWQMNNSVQTRMKNDQIIGNREMDLLVLNVFTF